MTKGLSNVISVMIVLIILGSILAPVMIYLQNIQSVNEPNIANMPLVNNYVYLKNLQEKQVTSGHPSFFYNGSYIYFQYSNGTFVPSSNVTIVGILYLNDQGVWVNITLLKYPIHVSSNHVLQLPSYVKDKPIIIVTSLGNIFFLQPGSAIGPYSTASGKGGVEIITQISTLSGPISVSTNITTNIYGTYANYSTPVTFPNQTGTFIVKVPQYIYYQRGGKVITGVFNNWVVLGKATLNTTNYTSVKVTLLNGPSILIANYTLLQGYATLTIQTNTPNVGVYVSINGQTYQIYGSRTIQIPAGFFNLTIYTLQFNDTTQRNNGIIKHYVFSNIQYQGKTYTIPSQILFISPTQSQYIYINYNNDFNYYYVTFKAVNAPSGVNPVLNGTVYDYGKSYWIVGGKYIATYTGIFYGTYSCGVTQLVVQYANGTTFSYKFPNIPRYLCINQPLTVTAYYGVTTYWVSIK